MFFSNFFSFRSQRNGQLFRQRFNGVGQRRGDGSGARNSARTTERLELEPNSSADARRFSTGAEKDPSERGERDAEEIFAMERRIRRVDGRRTTRSNVVQYDSNVSTFCNNIDLIVSRRDEDERTNGMRRMGIRQEIFMHRSLLRRTKSEREREKRICH